MRRSYARDSLTCQRLPRRRSERANVGSPDPASGRETCDHRSVLTVRRSAARDIERCVAIVRELPDYFTEMFPRRSRAT